MYVVKQCTKCKEYKLLNKFYPKKNGWCGRDSKCIFCQKKYRTERYKDINVKKRVAYTNSVWRIKNKERFETAQKKYQEKISKQKAEARKKRELKKQNITHKKCSKCNNIKEIINFYKDRNTYRANCKDCQNKQSKKHINKYVRKRMNTDSLFKMRLSIRNLIYCSMKRQGYTKSSKTYKILGCDFDTFKKHIERQFTKGMTWENHGEWHYDHIIPISSAQTEEEVIKLNHYTNFQPLWAEDNLRKSNKIEPTQIKLRI